jgi:hypothetical protein
LVDLSELCDLIVHLADPGVGMYMIFPVKLLSMRFVEDKGDRGYCPVLKADMIACHMFCPSSPVSSKTTSTITFRK